MKSTTSFLRFFNSLGRFVYGALAVYEILNSFELVLHDVFAQKGVAVNEPREIAEEIFTCYQSLGWGVENEERLERVLISSLREQKERHCTNEVEIFRYLKNLMCQTNTCC